jgi:hypothetical protein
LESKRAETIYNFGFYENAYRIGNTPQLLVYFVDIAGIYIEIWKKPGYVFYNGLSGLG